jgi:hypothetical protein
MKNEHHNFSSIARILKNFSKRLIIEEILLKISQTFELENGKGKSLESY